jgi:hypothetical protein
VIFPSKFTYLRRIKGAQSTIYSSVPGGEFVFNCQGPKGAVLALPHGAHLEKLENLASMRQYAAKHAESWYKYVNETRGRGLVNGSLYLITGCEKAKSWGMASFHDVSLQHEFPISFRPTTDAEAGYRYRWQGAHFRHKHADSPPVDGTPLNQTTFIHAFAISLCEGLLARLRGGVEISQLVDSPSTTAGKSGRGFVPFGSQSSSLSWSLSFFGGGAPSGGRYCSGQVLVHENGIISDAAPIPKVRRGKIKGTLSNSFQIFHPSQIIHQHLLREVPIIHPPALVLNRSY